MCTLHGEALKQKEKGEVNQRFYKILLSKLPPLLSFLPYYMTNNKIRDYCLGCHKVLSLLKNQNWLTDVVKCNYSQARVTDNESSTSFAISGISFANTLVLLISSGNKNNKRNFEMFTILYRVY